MDEKKEIMNLLSEFKLPFLESWVDSELKENKCAFLAVIRFLRPLQKSLDYYLFDYEKWIDYALERNDTSHNMIKEMIDKGVSRETIARYSYSVARTAFNEVLYRLDDPAGGDYDLENEGEHLPRWRLIEEIRYYDRKKIHFKETGRPIHGMHSIFPFIDPSEDERLKNNL